MGPLFQAKRSDVVWYVEVGILRENLINNMAAETIALVVDGW